MTDRAFQPQAWERVGSLSDKAPIVTDKSYDNFFG